ncbi:hypothetical protein BH10ACI1_BH10ACI1_34270 [soil metagenome]
MIKIKSEGLRAARKITSSFLISGFMLILLTGSGFQISAKPFNEISWFLSPSDPFIQMWTNPNVIVTDNDWSNVMSINGFRGDGLTASPGVDPQTIVADGAGTPLNVIANQSNPNTLITGGVAEFDGIANPTIALKGSDTASAPHIVIRLNKKNCPDNKFITIGYKTRDLDSTANNAVQPIALQYRVGLTGNYTNIASAFVADATDPNAATKVLTVFATLPHIPVSEQVVYLRIMTANAVGNDEWVGIDDINIGCFAPLASTASVSGRVMSPNGQPVSSAIVTMNDEYGAIRTTRTNPFGYYKFDYIFVGGIVIVNAVSKKYQFEPQIVSVTDNVENVDFEGQP